MHAYHNMDSHMNFRMLADDKAIIEAAAYLTGLKPQTYARQRLVEIAKQDIAKSLSTTLVLDANGWDQFVAIMEAPIEVNKNLKEAVADFKNMMKQSKK